ncbi:MAG: glycosyltransferase family 4 protein [Oscillospiraceae bacterium]|nr:glycosyltransferase family 4 protein [Oscillospiraceae bacterium]
MKILLVNKFHYRKGGSETYYFALADALRRAGHEVIFFAMESEKNLPCEQADYFVSGVDYNGPQSVADKIKNGVKLLYSTEAKKKFAALLASEKPDVVHLNLVHRQITLSVVDACKEAGVPVVFTQHDLICVCPNYLCLSEEGVCEDCLSGSFVPCVKKRCVKGSRAKSLLGAAEAVLYRKRGTYHKIDCYITPSKFHSEMLKKGNFTSSEIRHIPNFLPYGTQFEKKAPVEGAGLLFLGRLSKEKGLETLLRAMALAADATLKIAGDGPQRTELEKLAEALGLSERVEFLGFLTGNALTEQLERCKAVVLPSECYENAPYSVMEAMASGKPVLGSRIGGVPELVQDGKTGFLFRPGDAEDQARAIRALCALDEAAYGEMCSNAVRFAAAELTEESHLAKLIPVYEKLIKKNA